MKKVLFMAIIAIACFGCVSKKNVAQQQPSKASTSQDPFGDVWESPCQVYDTPSDFAETGIFRGSSNQKGEVHKNALLNAQELIRLKMAHSYKGMVSEYSSSIGNNQGNDIERKMTAAGDRIIDMLVNESSETCVKWSSVESDGHITCYVAVKISKSEAASKIAKEVDNKLTQDEKDRIGFNEQQYREQMEKRFKDYKENK